MEKKSMKGWLYLLPALIIITVFTLYPLVKAFSMSIMLNYDMVHNTFTGYGFDAYQKVLTDKTFHKALLNTTIYSIVVVPCSIILSLLIAAMINGTKKTKGLFQTIYFLPYVTSVIAIGIVWSWIYNSRYGLLNSIMGLFGMEPIQWLNKPKYALPALIIFAVGQFCLFLLHRKKTDESLTDACNESAQWLCYGLVCGAIAVFPLIVAGRDINFSSSLDRFSWPGMIGAILFLIGLIGSVRNRVLRNILTMMVLIVSVFVQWQNQVNYADQWTMSKNYWQQMMWRAPVLKEGTTIVTGGSLLVEEDYDVFAPASMIYYPGEIDWAPVGAEVLNSNTVADILLGNNSGRYVREIFVKKDYDHLLAVSKPIAEGCLRVIDGDNPLYSAKDWTKIPSIGKHSKLSQIITAPEQLPDYPFFLEKELEHGWCYYFEKMELALQMF